MSGCTNPQIRLETNKRYKNQQGKWSYKAHIFPAKEQIKASDQRKQLNALMISGNYRRFDIIPCGKCLGCFLEKARDKAVQLSLEK